MKLFKILSHPYTLIISFLMILISGQHLGGFYMFYILLALPHGGVHSLFALAGIIILLINYNQHDNEKRSNIKMLLNLSGLAFLLVSIVLFFLNDRQHYNWDTFQQIIPISTLLLFIVIASCFLLKTTGVMPGFGKRNHRVSKA